MIFCVFILTHLKLFSDFSYDFLFESLFIRSALFNFHIFVKSSNSSLLLLLIAFHYGQSTLHEFIKACFITFLENFLWVLEKTVLGRCIRGNKDQNQKVFLLNTEGTEVRTIVELNSRKRYHERKKKSYWSFERLSRWEFYEPQM